MTAFILFTKRHPLLTYYALVFGISWGGGLAVIGPSGFLGITPLSDAQFMFLVLFAPLVGPSLAGILSAALVHGKAGPREMLSRLLAWRVDVRWYAAALLIAPLLMLAIGFALGQVPAVVAADDKISLVLLGVSVGLLVPLCEELGWTGFALPEWRRHRSILSAGIVMGLLWGLWHFPLFAGSASSSGSIHPVVYMVVLLFSWLPPYRVLMVWVYDRTKSLLVTILAHTPIAAGSFLFRPLKSSAEEIVASDLVFGAVLWIIVALVLVADQERAKLATSAG